MRARLASDKTGPMGLTREELKEQIKRSAREYGATKWSRKARAELRTMTREERGQ